LAVGRRDIVAAGDPCRNEGLEILDLQVEGLEKLPGAGLDDGIVEVRPPDLAGQRGSEMAGSSAISTKVVLLR